MTKKCNEYHYGFALCKQDVLHDCSGERKWTLAVPFICGNVSAAPIGFCRNRYEHLSNLELAVPDEGEPQILIGLDHYWTIVSGDVIQADSGPVAMYTKFGWVCLALYHVLCRIHQQAWLHVS